MNGLEVADPYVERLLEGVGFLAARVQLKLDAEFPRFTQALLEIVYPHYLAPTPSMLVAQLKPDPGDPNLASGITVPRGSTMHSLIAGDEATACEFRTAQDVRLWPIEVVSANYFSFAPDLPLNTLPVGAADQGWRADPAQDDRGAEVRADCRSTDLLSTWRAATTWRTSCTSCASPPASARGAAGQGHTARRTSSCRRAPSVPSASTTTRRCCR